MSWTPPKSGIIKIVCNRDGVLLERTAHAWKHASKPNCGKRPLKAEWVTTGLVTAAVMNEHVRQNMVAI